MSDFPPPSTLAPARPQHPDPPPTSPRLANVPPPPTAPPSDAVRRWWTGVPSAVWIGLVGSLLIIVASMFVVVARWDSIGRGLRTAGVTALTLGFVFAAYRLKRITPTMASIIVHLGAALTTMVGIATVSMFGFTWPSCIAVGGALGFCTSVWLSRRWHPSRFAYIEVVDLFLAATGVAALTHTTAGLWAVIAAAGCAVLGWHRRSVALAVAAVATPISALAAAAGVGAGTLARAGLVGDRLAWSGPVVGVIAGVVVVVAGRRLGRTTLVAAGAAMPLVGIATGLAAADLPIAVWWSFPGFALIALNIALEVTHSRTGGDTENGFENGVDGAGIVISALATLMAPLAQRSVVTTEIVGIEVGAGRWVLPALATLAGIATTVYRWRAASTASTRTNGILIDGALASLVAVSYAALVVLNVPRLAVAIIVLVVATVSVLLSRSRGPLLIGPSLLMVLLACVLVDFDGDDAVRWATVAVAATATAGAIVVRARRAAVGRELGILELVSLETVGVLVVTGLTGLTFVPTLLVVTAIATSIASFVDERLIKAQLVDLALVGGIAVEVYGVLGQRSWSWALAFSVAALSTVAVAVRSNDEAVWFVRPSMAAAGFAGLATVTALRTGHLTADLVLLSSCALALAATGMWFVTRRDWLGAYAASISGFVLVLTGTFGASDWWTSLVIILIGIEMVVLGIRLALRPVLIVGAATALVGVLSLIFTTPLNEWVTATLRRIDATPADLVLALVTVTALGAGGWARRRFDQTSWLAYTPGLVVGGSWLVAVSEARPTVWAVPLGLLLGVGATIVGASGRLGAPLVGGSVITIAMTISGYRNYVGSVPVWLWLGLGGLALIGVAVGVERGSKQGATLADLIERWQ